MCTIDRMLKAILILCIAGGAVGQESIYIENHSFEQLVLGDGGNVNAVPEGWTSSGGIVGVFNPSLTTYSDSAIVSPGSLGTMDGVNIAHMQNRPESLSQTLTTSVVPGAVYTLTVAIGDRDVGNRPTPFGYTLSLLAGGELLASTTNSVALVDGSFTDVSLSYTATAEDSGLLEVMLTSEISSGGLTLDFDNFRLSVVEPSLETTSPVSHQIIQRNEGQATVSLAGAVSGDARYVQARAIDLAGQGGDVFWTTIASEVSGSFSAELTLQTGWYDLLVRTLDEVGGEIERETISGVGVGDIYVVAGQSNSANFGENLQSAVSDMVSFYHTGDDHWSHATDPVVSAAADGGTGGSVWPLLGDRLLEISPNVPVAFIPIGDQNSTMFSWHPLTADNYPNLSAVLDGFGPQGVKAVLWHHEYEVTGIPNDSYAYYLEKLIGASRSDAGWDVPWFLSVSSIDSTVAGAEIVQEQLELIRDDPYTYLGSYTDDLVGTDPESALQWRYDGHHFSDHGLAAFSQRWERALMVQDDTGPLMIRAAHKTGEQFDVSFEGVPGLTYRLRRTTDLSGGFHIAEGSTPVKLDGVRSSSLRDTAAADEKVFYQVEVLESDSEDAQLAVNGGFETVSPVIDTFQEFADGTLDSWSSTGPVVVWANSFNSVLAPDGDYFVNLNSFSLTQEVAVEPETQLTWSFYYRAEAEGDLLTLAIAGDEVVSVSGEPGQWTQYTGTYTVPAGQLSTTFTLSSTGTQNQFVDGFSLLGTPLEDEDTRPNIIFLMTDDQRWDTLGCYGRSEFNTANIDRLSSEGVTFDNAHHAVAICTPSRATVMTGQYFAKHQSGFSYPFNVGISADAFNDSYHALLKAAGYRSGFVGKYDIPVYGGGRDHFDFFALRNRYEKPTADPVMDAIYRSDRDPRERTLLKGDVMMHFLDTQPKGQPFILSVSFDAVKNDKDEDMYAPHVELFSSQEMSVPANWVEGENALLPQVVQDYWRGAILHPGWTSTPALYQTLARRFATQGYSVDQQVARLMNKLEEIGELDNTVIIFTSDNGRFHGSHGLFGKCVLYEEATRAPLIIWDGRTAGQTAGFRVDELISTTDFAPTMLSLAGVEIPDSMQGQDLTPLLVDGADNADWRDAVFMEFLFNNETFTAMIRGEDVDAANEDLIANNRSYRARGVRTKEYKYFIYYEQSPVIEELYDLTIDPGEEQNLVDDSSYQEVLIELRAKTEELYQAYKAE